MERRETCDFLCPVNSSFLEPDILSMQFDTLFFLGQNTIFSFFLGYWHMTRAGSFMKGQKEGRNYIQTPTA
jgi:hypothetical protein